jgi:hypothetical protein
MKNEKSKGKSWVASILAPLYPYVPGGLSKILPIIRKNLAEYST